MASGCDVYMVNIGFISGDIFDVEAARLGNFFHEIKLLAGFWQSRKDKEEGIHRAVRYLRPYGCERDVFGMYKPGTGSGNSIYQVRCLPDPNQHILPFVSEVTVDIYERIVQRFGINPGEDLNVHFRFGDSWNLAVLMQQWEFRRWVIHDAELDLKFTEYFFEKLYVVTPPFL